MTEPKLIVHGGAWDIPDQYVDAHVQVSRYAAVPISTLRPESSTSIRFFSIT